jgi:hypothetical protein
MSDDIDAIMADARPNLPTQQPQPQPQQAAMVVAEPKARVPLGRRGLEADNLDSLYRIAVMYLEGGAFKPEFFAGCESNRSRLARVMFTLEKGMAIGLAPTECIDAMAFIRGKITIYGDALVACVKRHPECTGISTVWGGDGDEFGATVTVGRRNQADVVVKFTIADAKRAGLWGQRGPWSSYPQRMLQQRARGFAMRDQFPDALMGAITAEEVQDYRDDWRTVPTPPAAAQLQPSVQPEALPAPQKAVEAAPRPQEPSKAQQPPKGAPTAAQALAAIRTAPKGN